MLELAAASVNGRLSTITTRILPGQVTAICGPNGAGKSTLLSLLAGLLAPDSGSVLLDGDVLGAMPHKTRAQAIGYLPQRADLAWDISVRTLVALGRLPHKAGVQVSARAVDAALASMALDDLAQRPLSTLSGGEQARAMLARVLAGEPRWILADEPLASLDLVHQAGLLGHFRRLAAEGKAVVVVLHDLAAAMNWADRVVVLHQGSIASDGPPADALSPNVLARVWQVRGEWLGSANQCALLLHQPD
jgi:iron complex transport system ATP-binding protein